MRGEQATVVHAFAWHMAQTEQRPVGTTTLGTAPRGDATDNGNVTGEDLGEVSAPKPESWTDALPTIGFGVVAIGAMMLGARPPAGSFGAAVNGFLGAAGVLSLGFGVADLFMDRPLDRALNLVM